MSPDAASSPLSLQEQLDEITARTRALVPAERLAHTEQMIAEVGTLGLDERVFTSDERIPEFSLASAHGKMVHSADLLAVGPVVISFFRGRWCPYDMTELENWQALEAELRGRRVLLVGISPQTPRQNAFTAERHNLRFPLLSDPDCAVAARFGYAYTVPEHWRSYYRSMLVNIPLMNGNNDWKLPIPATVVLRPPSVVWFAKAYADPRRRPEPAEVLAALDALPPRI